MSMITKTRGESTVIEHRSIVRGLINTDTSYPMNFPWTSSISYEKGPSHTVDGHVNWKRCTQASTNRPRGQISCTYEGAGLYDQTIYTMAGSTRTFPLPSFKNDDLFRDCCSKFWDQVDLNTSESVMCYSGIVQAVPMLGALTKANQVINKIGRWATRSLRRKPFTEVVKTAISADFLKRFVIDTTLADLRMVADATDYVVRTITTARNRMAAPVSFTSESSKSSVEAEGEETLTMRGHGSTYVVSHNKYRRAYDYTTRLDVLATVRYDITPTTSLKLLANRLGITRPLDSAWDLVPFSFVADYFTCMGDFLGELGDRMTSIDGLTGQIGEIRDVWCQNKVEYTTSHSATGRFDGPYNAYMQYVTQAPSGSVKNGSFRYERYNGFPLLEKVGFWDEHGLIQPKLTSTRSRTLLQLFLQSKLR